MITNRNSTCFTLQCSLLSQFHFLRLGIWLITLCSMSCKSATATPHEQSDVIGLEALTVYSFDGAQVLAKAEESDISGPESGLHEAFVVFCVQGSGGKYLMEYKSGGRRPDLYDEYWNGREACIYDRESRIMRVMEKPNEFLPGFCVRNNLDLGGRVATDLLRKTLRLAKPDGIAIKEQGEIVDLSLTKKDGSKLHLTLLKVGDIYLLKNLLSESASGNLLLKIVNSFSGNLASKDDIIHTWERTEVSICFDTASKAISSTRYTILSVKSASQLDNNRFSPSTLSLGKYIIKDYRLGDYRQYKTERGPLPLDELRNLKH